MDATQVMAAAAGVRFAIERVTRDATWAATAAAIDEAREATR